MANILVIEGDALLGESIRRTLQKLDHTIHIATTCKEGLRLFEKVDPDVTLLDLRLPDGEGLDVLAKLREEYPPSNVLMITAYATIEDAVRAIKLGARDYLQKPLQMEDLRHAITRALAEAQMKREPPYSRSRSASGAGIHNVLGESEVMQDLRSKILRLCSVPVSAPPVVLLTGETGTGKGLVARAFHHNGPRADRPFIEVNCAALPEHLVESELFGHERGAFTDAQTAKQGLFQAADHGALFLDEIGSLPASSQVKLLKAIEEQNIRPLGGNVARTIDVQIIAATNSDLEAMVSAGSFRADLYYRLSVAHLTLPPLRERDADVTLLASAFLSDLARSYRMPAKRLTREATQLLTRYTWPGNVRELRNTLERAMLFCEGAAIDVAALSFPEPGLGYVRIEPDDEGGLSIDMPQGGIQFDTFERALLLEALRKSGGSQSGAARMIGMTRATLRYRLEKFGIESSMAPEHGERVTIGKRAMAPSNGAS